MPRLVSMWGLWLLLCMPVCTTIIPTAAHASGGGGGGGGGGSADDESDDDDDEEDQPLKTTKRGKLPSYFEIKPSQRLGLRHAFDPNFTLEAFVRTEQDVLDNPLSLRSSQVGGGLQSYYKSGATTWFVLLQTKEIFSHFYEHTTRTEYEARTALQHQIDFGTSGFSVVPRVQIGYKWSNDLQLERWKFEVTTPLSYKLSDTVLLLPFIPKLSYQPYTRRSDDRADWTMTMSAGIRWFFAAPSFVETDFGFENRWSNVQSANSSRWKLTPKINLRVPF